MMRATPDHCCITCSTMSRRRPAFPVTTSSAGAARCKSAAACRGRNGDIQGAHSRRGRCDLRRGGEFLGAASARCRHENPAARRDDGEEVSRPWAIAAPCCRESAYPKLPADVLSLDFSGWTVFVHAEADDELVTRSAPGSMRARCAFLGRNRGICRSSAWRARRSTRRRPCRCIPPPSDTGRAAAISESAAAEQFSAA